MSRLAGRGAIRRIFFCVDFMSPSKMGAEPMIIIPGSSKCVKFLPFHQKNLPKGRIFTYLEDPGIINRILKGGGW